MLDKIPHLGLVLSCFRKLLMIDSISLIAEGLFTRSISFCVSFGRWSLKELVHFIQDEMVGWHRLNGCEFEQTLGGSQGQGRLACCSSWGHKESDMTQQRNNSISLFSCSPNCECCCTDFCVSHSHAPKTWTKPLFMPRLKGGGHSFRFKC